MSSLECSDVKQNCLHSVTRHKSCVTPANLCLDFTHHRAVGEVAATTRRSVGGHALLPQASLFLSWSADANDEDHAFLPNVGNRSTNVMASQATDRNPQRHRC